MVLCLQLNRPNLPRKIQVKLTHSLFISYSFTLFEPISSIKEIYVAKQKLMHPVSPRIMKTVPSIKPPSIFTLPSSPNLKSPKKKVLEIAHRGPLPLEIKMHIAGVEHKYRYIAEEVG